MVVSSLVLQLFLFSLSYHHPLAVHESVREGKTFLSFINNSTLLITGLDFLIKHIPFTLHWQINSVHLPTANWLSKLRLVCYRSAVYVGHNEFVTEPLTDETPSWNSMNKSDEYILGLYWYLKYLNNVLTQSLNTLDLKWHSKSKLNCRLPALILKILSAILDKLFLYFLLFHECNTYLNRNLFLP